MSTHIHDVAASFDARAATYSENEWHQRCAERLVSVSGMAPGQSVLDAGTGTGFAARAAARAVGRSGRVCGVDISAGMLGVARAEQVFPDAAAIEWQQGDATQLSGHHSASFDIVLCAAGLLYMPVPAALREWHRVLKPGGSVAFSSMRAGSPLAGRIFRESAAAFGLSMGDPSEALGSEVASAGALATAGFAVARVVGETIQFSPQDLSLAWESNLRSAHHAEVLRLSATDLARLRAKFDAAATDAELTSPGSMRRADVLYVVGSARIASSG